MRGPLADGLVTNNRRLNWPLFFFFYFTLERTIPRWCGGDGLLFFLLLFCFVFSITAFAPFIAVLVGGFIGS